MLTTAAALASSPPPLPGFLNALASPLQHYGIWAIGLLILLEDFGVPAPGETVLIAGAIYAGAGRLNVVAVGVVGFVAAVIGDNIGFAIGHFGGRALALRWGRYVFLTEERLNKAELFFHRHGGKVIVIARFVEGLRQANGIMAGIAGMHWRRFLAFNALGAALWVGTCAWRLLRRRRGATAAASTASGADETHDSRDASEAAGIAPGEPGCGAHASPGDAAGEHPPAGHQHGEPAPGEHVAPGHARDDHAPDTS